MTDVPTPYNRPPSPTIKMDDFYPYEYLVRVHPRRCNNCDQVHFHSEVFLVRVHSSLGHSTAGRHLTPVEEIKSELPIGVTRLPEKRIAICHSCFDKHPLFDKPHDTPESTESGWSEALKRDAAARRQAELARARAAAHPPQSRPSKPTPNFKDDLSDIPV